MAMKQKYRLFQRGSSGSFFLQDRATGKQTSLKTQDRAEAQRLLHAYNEAHEQPLLNIQIGRAYLAAADPAVGTRTWQTAMEEYESERLRKKVIPLPFAEGESCTGSHG